MKCIWGYINDFHALLFLFQSPSPSRLHSIFFIILNSVNMSKEHYNKNVSHVEEDDDAKFIEAAGTAERQLVHQELLGSSLIALEPGRLNSHSTRTSIVAAMLWV